MRELTLKTRLCGFGLTKLYNMQCQWKQRKSVYRGNRGVWSVALQYCQWPRGGTPTDLAAGAGWSSR